MNIHWTERSIKDYIFRIAADFVSQLEDKMESSPLTQDELAKELGVSKGRVSQVFNNPGNISVKTMVEYCKALNMKVAIVAYEDDDPENKKGLINSEIFKICWEKTGKPRDFWAFEEVSETIKQTLNPVIADRRRYLATAPVQGTSTGSEVVITDLLPRPTYVPSQTLIASSG